MFDTLPFPNMTAKDAEERSRQTIDYLLQLREELVFILDSIVSGEYGKVATQTSQKQLEEIIVNASSKDTLTVAEVINSAAFKAAMRSVEEKIPTDFTINFETGNLEYKTS